MEDIRLHKLMLLNIMLIKIARWCLTVAFCVTWSYSGFVKRAQDRVPSTNDVLRVSQ